jgi:hypothetical protein
MRFGVGIAKIRSSSRLRPGRQHCDLRRQVRVTRRILPNLEPLPLRRSVRERIGRPRAREISARLRSRHEHEFRGQQTEEREKEALPAELVRAGFERLSHDVSEARGTGWGEPALADAAAAYIGFARRSLALCGRSGLVSLPISSLRAPRKRRLREGLPIVLHFVTPLTSASKERC